MRNIATTQYCNRADLVLTIDSVVYTILNISPLSERTTELNDVVSQVNTTILGEYDIPADAVATVAYDGTTIFQGVVTAPIILKCGTTELSLINQIETKNVGFSPEESQLGYVNLFEPWPLGYGSPVLAKAVKIRQSPTTTTKTKICLIDAALTEEKQNTEDVINQAYFALNYWRVALNTLVEPNAVTTSTLYLEALNGEWVAQGLFRQSLKDLQERREVWSLHPNALGMANIIANLEVVLANSVAAIQVFANDKHLLEQHVQFLVFHWSQRRYIIRQMLDIWKKLREWIFNLYVIEQKLCEQTGCSTPNQLVNGSKDFVQSTNVNVRIAGLTFTVQFSGDNMTGITGPIDEKNSITVETWDAETTPCSEYDYFNSINTINTLETGLSGKWLLVTDTAGQKHVLFCEVQVNDRCYLKLVPWSSARFAKVQEQSLESNVYELANAPVYDAFDGYVDPNWFVGDWDPNVFTSRESVRYLEMIDILRPVATPDVKRHLAYLAYLEPYDALTGVVIRDPGVDEIFTVTGPKISSIDAVSTRFNPTWATGNSLISEELEAAQTGGSWEAPPGTEVTEDTCEIYVVNLLPSTIKGVYAYYTDKDRRYLRQIPSRYYIDRQESLSGSTETIEPQVLIFDTPLGEIQGWENDVYVSYESSVGPRITDILQHIGETYTDKTIDTVSFSAVETLFADKYPANFVVYDQPDALKLMNLIAWEARCAVTLRDDQYHLEYLSAEPTLLGNGVVDSTTIIDTRVIESESTEDLITRYDVTWTKDGLDLDPERLTLRYNIDTHGLKAQSHSFLIFDKYDLVHKTMNFWLMRRGNMYKNIRANCTIEAINYQIFDGCTNYLNKGRVLEWTYTHSTRSVTMLVETGIRYDESSAYQFFWPAAISASLDWPETDQSNDITGSISCG